MSLPPAAPPHPVALWRCADYTPEALEPALDAALAAVGGLAATVRPGMRVLLKPNLIAGLPPERCATTHPALLEALARRVLDLGAVPFIADAPAWGGPRAVAEATGVADVCERLGIDFVFFDRHSRVPGRFPAVASHVHVDPRLTQADAVINVPKLKAHVQLGFTGAMKNLYGCMAGREKAFHHLARSKTDHVFARFLVNYQASLPIDLHVADAVWAMEGSGPRLGSPRAVGALAVSRGAVELDAVLAELIGVPPSHRLLLDAAAELGAGETDPARILLLGDSIESLALPDFAFPHLVGVFFSPWRLLRGWWRNRRLLRTDAAPAR